jgi:aspartate ammonia-lyase
MSADNRAKRPRHAVDRAREPDAGGTAIEYRIERDSLGEVRVPAAAYYGAQTARAVENFPISGLHAPDALVTATVMIKRAAALANGALGRLDSEAASAIAAAADEIVAGALRDQFVVDVYQAGAGTSHNMNANEVLANRAAELLGEPRGRYARVHPNDHVNMGQSTNDVYPTATRLALLLMLPELLGGAAELADALAEKARAYAQVLKTGRTHLQDAVPITLGQEFGGYADNVKHAAAELQTAASPLHELNLGATAVGTGLNAGEDFTHRTISILARGTALALHAARNRFRVTQSMGDVLAYSGALRRLAVEVGKIASDLRLLSMGPRAGIAEVRLPPVQPGSSIMPGKVNPSVPEMVNQVCFQVIGCDAAILAAADAGQLELNVMMPVIAWNALHATQILGRAMRVLAARTIRGLEADDARCRELLDRSTAMATALSPYIGYAATAEIAKLSVQTGRPIREIVLERGLLSPDRLDAILSPAAMTSPGIAGEDRHETGTSARRNRGADARRPGGRRAARPAVSAEGSRAARRTGPRSVAASRTDHGRARDRGRQRGR